MCGVGGGIKCQRDQRRPAIRHGTDESVPALPGRGRLAHQRVRRIGRQDRSVPADPYIPHRPAAQARVRQMQRHRQRISRVLYQHARVPETT